MSPTGCLAIPSSSPQATGYLPARLTASVSGFPPGKGLLSSVARALVFGLFAVTAKGRRFNPCSRLLFCCVLLVGLAMHRVHTRGCGAC